LRRGGNGKKGTRGCCARTLGEQGENSWGGGGNFRGKHKHGLTRKRGDMEKPERKTGEVPCLRKGKKFGGGKENPEKTETEGKKVVWGGTCMEEGDSPDVWKNPKNRGGKARRIRGSLSLLSKKKKQRLKKKTFPRH